MAQSFTDLRSMSREELIRQHDSMAKNTVVGTRHFLTELARRDAEDANNTMLALTKQMRNFTAIILFLTIVNVAVFVASLFLS